MSASALMILKLSLSFVLGGVIVIEDMAVPSSLSMPYSAKTVAVASSAVIFAVERFFLSACSSFISSLM